jgi:hypothetical protein
MFSDWKYHQSLVFATCLGIRFSDWEYHQSLVFATPPRLLFEGMRTGFSMSMHATDPAACGTRKLRRGLDHFTPSSDGSAEMVWAAFQ